MNRGRHLRLPILLVAAFVLLTLVISSVLLSLRQQRNAGIWVRHSLEVEARLYHIQTLVTDAEAGQRGYLLTGRDYYLQPFRTAERIVPIEFAQLATQIVDNPGQQRSAAKLRQLSDIAFAQLRKVITFQEKGQSSAALAIVSNDSGKSLTDAIRTQIAAMRDVERALLDQRTRTWSNYVLRSQLLVVGAVLITIAVALFVLSDARRRLRALARTNDRLKQAIAERAAAESKVAQLQKMEAVGQLTGGIAHDFNNMLAIVIGSLDLARRRLTGSEDPKVARFIGNAHEGAERAAVLTARLLAFSRQQPLDPKIIDANKMVSGMSELLRRTIGEPVKIETVLAGGLWRTLADPGQLENAIVNLAVNARDAMPGGGRLTIETANANLDDRYAREHTEVEPGQYVLISVTDTGFGMPASVIDRAFEPFFTTKSVDKGTGLGLSQVFGFVKQSGGHIKIYSEVDHGTTIKIYLPRHTGEGQVAETMERNNAYPTGSASEVILVVEDEEKVRHMSVEALRELGYTVVSTSSPIDALAQLSNGLQLSLLFTDIVMPEMSGRQLAEKAAEVRPGIQVLYTTGYTSNAVVHGGVLDPGTAFLPKPFTIEQLAFKVRESLDAQRN